MQIFDTSPRDWDARIAFPILSRGFAEAAASLGQRALFVEDGEATALVLVRALPIPGVRSWTTRARAYVSRGDGRFVGALARALAAQGIARLTIGDAVWGTPRPALEAAGASTVVSHLMRQPPAASDAELFARLTRGRRAAVRRAEREGVVVSEVRTEEELRHYCALAAATARRARDTGIVLPVAFFAALFRSMVPRRQAVIFLARRGDDPLAGAIFVASADRMTCLHSVSSRERRLTVLNGPTAVIWHALRVARARGIGNVDLGPVTPTEDPAHPHHSVYRFKRRFGGYVDEQTHGAVTLSPVKYAFQERVMLPVWKRAYRLYHAAFGARAEAPEEALSGIDLRWAGVPADHAEPPAIPPVPWEVDEILAGIAALQPVAQRPFAALPITRAARRHAVSFTRSFHRGFGGEAPRPAVTATVDGGIAFCWPQEVTGSRHRVEIVFFQDFIEYAVVDGTDVTAPEQLLVDGETRDVDDVLREVVKPYVIR